MTSSFFAMSQTQIQTLQTYVQQSGQVKLPKFNFYKTGKTDWIYFTSRLCKEPMYKLLC